MKIDHWKQYVLFIYYPWDTPDCFKFMLSMLRTFSKHFSFQFPTWFKKINLSSFGEALRTLISLHRILPLNVYYYGAWKYAQLSRGVNLRSFFWFADFSCVGLPKVYNIIYSSKQNISGLSIGLLPFHPWGRWLTADQMVGNDLNRWEAPITIKLKW